MSTTMTTFLKDRVKTSILIYEPRINLLSLDAGYLSSNGRPECRSLWITKLELPTLALTWSIPL